MKFFLFYDEFNSYLQTGHATSVTGPLSSTAQRFSYYGGILLAFKITISGGNVTYSYAYDCLNYMQLYTESFSSAGSPNQVGIYASSVNASQPVMISVVHWKVS